MADGLAVGAAMLDSVKSASAVRGESELHVVSEVSVQ